MFPEEAESEVFILGTKILSTIIISILMVGAVDIFSEWYKGFLNKRGINPKIILLIRRATFVILAFMFWRSLVAEQQTEEFASTHFFFALFVYCAYRLISTYFKGKAE